MLVQSHASGEKESEIPQFVHPLSLEKANGRFCAEISSQNWVTSSRINRGC